MRIEAVVGIPLYPAFAVVMRDPRILLREVSEDTEIENGTVYNLAGQRVNKAQKGLYIVNGAIVIK